SRSGRRRAPPSPACPARPAPPEPSCGKPVGRIRGLADGRGARAAHTRVMAEHTKIVVVGGGVAALEGALALQALVPQVAEVELVAPERDFTYRPMLAAEPFGHGGVRAFPLRRLVEAAGASLREAVVTGVDTEHRLVRTASSDAFPYDQLLLAPGAVPVTAVPGALCFRGPPEAGALERVLE